jgi:hypothetical protein
MIPVNNPDAIVDYAMPTMMAEVQLKKLHEAFLAKDIEEAKRCALLAAKHSLEAWEALNESKG